jgi:hypothetical protein
VHLLYVNLKLSSEPFDVFGGADTQWVVLLHYFTTC